MIRAQLLIALAIGTSLGVSVSVAGATVRHPVYFSDYGRSCVQWSNLSPPIYVCLTAREASLGSGRSAYPIADCFTGNGVEFGALLNNGARENFTDECIQLYRASDLRPPPPEVRLTATSIAAYCRKAVRAARSGVLHLTNDGANASLPSDPAHANFEVFVLAWQSYDLILDNPANPFLALAEREIGVPAGLKTALASAKDPIAQDSYFEVVGDELQRLGFDCDGHPSLDLSESPDLSNVKLHGR
jgi:hypothetical protein